MDECIAIRNRQRGCDTGEAVITSCGNLPAKYVIHTVGPVWSGGNQSEAGIVRDDPEAFLSGTGRIILKESESYGILHKRIMMHR